MAREHGDKTHSSREQGGCGIDFEETEGRKFSLRQLLPRDRAKLSGKAHQLPRRRGPSGSSRNGGEAPPHPNNLTGRPSGREFHACSSSLKKGKNTGSEAIPGGPGTLCQPVRVGGKCPDDSRGPLGHPSASRTFPFSLLPSDEGAAVFTCCPKEGVLPQISVQRLPVTPWEPPLCWENPAVS